MKEEKFYCDRCGKEIENCQPKIIDILFNLSYVETFGIFLTKTERKNKNISDKKELCKECYDSFWEWFNLQR